MQKSLKGKVLIDYELAIEKFCNDNKDLTIYLAGEISHPGISDLDFLVVNKKPKINKEVSLFLAGGNVIIMPDFFMSKVRDFENINLKHLQGKVHQIEDPSIYFKYVEIIEWLPERILKLKSLNSKDLLEQELLLLHKSVNRSVRSVISLSGKKIDIIDENVIRTDKSINKKLVLKETIKYAELAWLCFEDYMLENKIISGEVSGGVNISSYYNFYDKFNTLKLYFNTLSNLENNQLSKELKSRTDLEGNSFLDPEFKEYIVNRWQNMNRMFMWFRKNNFKRGMIKYGWFL